MAERTAGGMPIETVGDLPSPGTVAPDFILAGKDLSPLTLKEFRGKNVVLNIFTSIDTSTCAASVRRFNEEAASLKDTVVLCVSADLPFAAERFCAAEGLDRVYTGSVFRNREFGRDYGVAFADDSPLAGLLARSIVIVDGEGRVVYNQPVIENSHEPDYDSALAAVREG